MQIRNKWKESERHVEARERDRDTQREREREGMKTKKVCRMLQSKKENTVVTWI